MSKAEIFDVKLYAWEDGKRTRVNNVTLQKGVSIEFPLKKETPSEVINQLLKAIDALMPYVDAFEGKFLGHVNYGVNTVKYYRNIRRRN